MKNLGRYTQKIIFGSSFVFILATVAHDNAISAESNSQENNHTIQMAVERAAHQTTALADGRVLKFATRWFYCHLEQYL